MSPVIQFLTKGINYEIDSLNKSKQTSKIKASILGFCVALYQLILQYVA